MLVEIGNKVYRRIDEIEVQSCKGCVADGNTTLCEAIIDKFGAYSCDSDKNTYEVSKIYEEVDRFKSTREMWEWLLAGNKIRNSTNLYYYYITMHPDGNLYKHQNDYISRLDIFDYSLYKPYIEPEWYEAIPEQGVLCWLHDFHSDRKDHVALVKEFDDSRENKFVCFRSEARIVDFKFATPLTKEELLERFYER